MTTGAAVVIRRLDTAEHAGIMPLVAQLRPHLDEVEFLRRVTVQAQAGYEIYAAFIDGEAVGFAGLRPVSTLARGPHMHLDDLVVTAARRGQGLGARLLAFAEAEARRRGLGKLFLDARQQAIPFYELCGYRFHEAPLMRKDL